MEGKIIEGRKVLKHVTTSDEALCIMRDYDKIPTKEDRKRTKMG